MGHVVWKRKSIKSYWTKTGMKEHWNGLDILRNWERRKAGGAVQRFCI